MHSAKDIVVIMLFPVWFAPLVMYVGRWITTGTLAQARVEHPSPRVSEVEEP